MKTFQEIYVESEKFRVSASLYNAWQYCLFWFLATILLVIFVESASAWLLTIFPATAFIVFIQAVRRVRQIEKKGLDLTEFHAIINKLDRNI